MKNIFVLPSDKPSRIGYIGELESYHFFNDKENNNELFDNLVVNRNIYITNSEEIKEGHYGIGHATGLFGVGEKDYLFKHDGSEKGRLNSICVGAKKIILTTDPELIKNGVQAIKDDFLEWFVFKANDSGKPIDIIEVERGYLGIGGFVKSNEVISKDKLFFKPIIPTKEQKQEICPLCEKNVLIDNVCKECTEQLCKPFSKQETIEEATDRIAKECGYDIDGGKVADFVDGMVKGAEWQKHQSEKMFSEGEVLLLLKQSNIMAPDFGWGEEDLEEWFTQHKKH